MKLIGRISALALLALAIITASPVAPAQASESDTYCYRVSDRKWYACSTTDPLIVQMTAGSAAIGSVTQGTTPWVDNVTQWASGVLGAMANYGTSPGAVLVPGANVFVTNTPAVNGSTGTFPPGAAASGVAIGNVGALTKAVCVTPTVTNGTYNANVVIGGLLTFTNLFTAAHSGTIQAIALNFTSTQTVGFLFYPFATSPTGASTWTDHSAAAISGSADIFSVRTPTPLGNATSNLGAGTNYGALGIGQAIVSTDANLYGILVPTATTASLGGTANVVQVCVKVLQDN